MIGQTEVGGPEHNPLLIGLAQWVTPWVKDDETAWCGLFCGWCCKFADIHPPDHAARARSWLTVGTEIRLAEARPGFDVAIFKRGPHPQPGPDVLDATGHVGLFVGPFYDGRILVLGGNQSNMVSIAPFPVSDLLGIRRLS
jgi:uncharacterized protein (TIGR02594 family)